MQDKIVFGLSRIHHIKCLKNRLFLLRSITDLGIFELDTASIYGHGIADHTLQLLQSEVSNLKINTKIGLHSRYYCTQNFAKLSAIKLKHKLLQREEYFQNFSKIALTKQLNDILESLSTNKVNMLFLHEPIYVDGIDEEITNFQHENKDKFHQLGISGEPDTINQFLKKSSLEFDIYQTRQIKSATSEELREKFKSPAYSLYGFFYHRRKKEVVKYQPLKDSKFLFSSTNLENVKRVVEWFN
jgi:predicted oxidoreductase